LLLVNLDSLPWQELHDYSNRDKWKQIEIGIWGMDYGIGIENPKTGDSYWFKAHRKITDSILQRRYESI